MYCIKCGVKLADSEKKCPLCETKVYHPDIDMPKVEPLFPDGKMPDAKNKSKALNGAVIILFLIPLIVCIMADIMINGIFGWSGYAVGALLVFYIAFALPHWFTKPNPVIFTPITFAAVILYLLYINFYTGGNWFLSYAFPISGGLCLITTAVVTLLYYLKKGKLYIVGGAFMVLGAFMLLIEFLMVITFNIKFLGWSLYPLIVLILIGALLIYLAISPSARETLERKFFF